MYQQSLETYERVGDEHGQAVTWGNLGNVYGSKGEWDRAIEMYQQSLETYKHVGNAHGMAQAWGNLGNFTGNVVIQSKQQSIWRRPMSYLPSWELS